VLKYVELLLLLALCPLLESVVEACHVCATVTGQRKVLGTCYILTKITYALRFHPWLLTSVCFCKKTDIKLLNIGTWGN